MNLSYNEYLGYYQSDDGSIIWDPASGTVYQYNGSSFVPVGTAYAATPQPAPLPTYPAPFYPPPAYPNPTWPSWPSWPPSPAGPAQPWPTNKPGPVTNPSPTPSARPPVYVIPPKPGSVVPSAMPAPSGGNVVPFKVPAPPATPPAPGKPLVTQGAPPPRNSGTAPKYIPTPSGTGSGGSITKPTVSEDAGFWEIYLDTDGYWADSPHEYLFDRTALKVGKVRYPDGRMWEHKGIVVMKERNPTPGTPPGYFILYDNPSPRIDRSYWKNVQGVQVQPVAPF